MTKNTISVIIIAKDEEGKIGDAIKSAEWADEVVVIDNASEDNTSKVSMDMGVKVYNAPKKYQLKYSKLRNLGKEKAKSDWILYLDADERITEELKNEIITLLETESKYPAYAIPRKNIILGKVLKHGGFGKYDFVKRLFERSILDRWVGDLHEEPQYIYQGELTKGGSGKIGHLKEKMLHIKAQSLEEMIEKTNKWSNLEARLMFESGHPPMNMPRFMSAMFREFWNRFFVHKAFLDGTIGIIHGLYQVYSRFISYAKLYERQINNSDTNQQKHTNTTNEYE